MGKTAKSFYQKYLNGGWDYDHAYGLQCVDGARIWMDYYIGKSIPTGNGWASGYVLVNKKWFLNNGCTFISNPASLKDGDLVVWGKGGSHPNTHVAMYYNGREFGMNQGSNRKFTLKDSNFSDMIGAFRSKNCIQPKTNTSSNKKYKLVYQPMLYQKGYSAGKKKRVAVELNLRKGNSTTTDVIVTLNPDHGDYVKYYGWYAGDCDNTGKFWLWVNAYKYNTKTKTWKKYTGFCRNDADYYKD